jgi:cytochrome c oxidase subunit 3
LPSFGVGGIGTKILHLCTYFQKTNASPTFFATFARFSTPYSLLSMSQKGTMLSKNMPPKEALQTAMHPKKFVLWLFIVSIIMFFAAFTSAYIVRRADGNWLLFDLPSLFYWSTGVILLSSLTMQYAYRAAKKDEIGQVKTGLVLTFFLGLVFLVMQVKAWGQLVDIGVFLGGSQSNPAGSFIYIISGAHWLHIVAGLVFVFFTLIHAFRYKVHAKSLLRISLCNTFWHFLDLLWVYLFLFLVWYR